MTDCSVGSDASKHYCVVCEEKSDSLRLSSGLFACQSCLDVLVQQFLYHRHVGLRPSHS